jgi:heavy metal translocating P-type ATPase
MAQQKEKATLDHTAHSHEHCHDHHEDHDHALDHDHAHAFEWPEMARIGLVAVAVVATWLRLWHPFAGYDFVGLAATLIGGYPIFKEAFESLLERRMTMELSMTLALGSALAIGEVFTALVITLFVLVAEVLEGFTVGRGRRAIKDLLNLLPRSVTVRRNGNAQEIGSADLIVGDVVVIKPGTRIAVDGRVIGGTSFVDQAAVTGESLPVEKVEGSSVFAGTVNQSGVLEVETIGVGKDTAFGKIIQAVEAAEKSRAPIQKTADRLAGYLVYFAIGAAILTYIITRDVRSTISVVIVAGACGIAAGTPLAILGAIGLAARSGAIVKGGLYIEALGVADTVVLDKTGTLTFGKAKVAETVPVAGVSERELLEAAAIAERNSEHPLGQAILDKASESGLMIIEPETFTYTPGKGITCTLKGDTIDVGNRALMAERNIDLGSMPESPDHLSEVYIARSGRFLGVIRIADTLRSEATEAIKALRAMGLKTVLLTGDASPIAKAVGKQVGVDEVEGDLLPEDKLARVKTLAEQGRKVVMVGDGINDAPALMQASVGVAMGTGTDVAQESANILLLGNDLLKFVETVKIARRCRRIIMFNFAGTLIVDMVGILLAACGLLNPLLAAFIHVASEMTFILNSARLLPRGSSRSEPVASPEIVVA